MRKLRLTGNVLALVGCFLLVLPKAASGQGPCRWRATRSPSRFGLRTANLTISRPPTPTPGPSDDWERFETRLLENCRELVRAELARATQTLGAEVRAAAAERAAAGTSQVNDQIARAQHMQRETEQLQALAREQIAQIQQMQRELEQQQESTRQLIQQLAIRAAEFPDLPAQPEIPPKETSSDPETVADTTFNAPKSNVKIPEIRTYTHPTDGSVLAWITSGTFRMGSDAGDNDERPVHEVRIDGFWLGKYEVTNQQYARFLEATGNPEPWYWNEPGYDDPQQPVVGITWHAAVRYCEWAGLRLPTEAEWEYAASGGQALAYPTSTGEISPQLANYRQTTSNLPSNKPTRVGSFPPNPFGLYDMAGNAWEHTACLYQSYPHEADALTDGRGLRVLRGGSWMYPPHYCRTSHRRRFAQHLTFDAAGFRVAIGAEELLESTGSAEPKSESEPVR